ncbi:MAG: hypothetical protein BWY74_03430 [Firmicutes bacterium ADurb.Bin419]|nr:MAG: hypothetical protein BWY74_03430 [Firmicutes bacterium ADurb.Bin419]
MNHGLFGKLQPGNLTEFKTWQEVAKEIRELSYQKVNIFRSVISFSPETVAELGLKDHNAWENYIEKHIHILASKNGISRRDLSWVCAHHNEPSHPHIHIVFWDKNQKTMKNYVSPKVADSIRIQLIKETFAEKIADYCRAKEKYKSELKEVTDDLVNDFDDYMKTIYPKQYKKLKEAAGKIDDEELKDIPIDSILKGIDLSPLSIRLFQLKDILPKKGRLYYQLLPEEAKEQVDSLVEDLKRGIPHIKQLIDEYADTKSKMAMLYDTDPVSVERHGDKAIKEMDKLIANRLITVIKTLSNKEFELSKLEYSKEYKSYNTQQMICEILMMIEQNVDDLNMDYIDRQKAESTELSKRAKKELYLRNRDKGMGK